MRCEMRWIRGEPTSANALFFCENLVRSAEGGVSLRGSPAENWKPPLYAYVSGVRQVVRLSSNGGSAASANVEIPPGQWSYDSHHLSHEPNFPKKTTLNLANVRLLLISISMLSREENELLTRTGPGTPMGNLYRRFWLPAL